MFPVGLSHISAVLDRADEFENAEDLVGLLIVEKGNHEPLDLPVGVGPYDGLDQDGLVDNSILVDEYAPV